MAKIRDKAVSIVTTAVASMAVEMPEHEAGDLLLFFFNKDTASGGPATPSGWSTVTGFTNPLNTTGSGNYLFAKRATSAAEALGTVAYTAETSIAIVLSIQGCYGTTVSDAISDCSVASASSAATLPLPGGTAFTPTYANSLVISFLGTDAVSGPFCMPGWQHVYGGDTGANSLACSYTFQRTPASLTHPGYYAQVGDDSKWAMLAIRDSGVGQVPAYMDRGTVPSYLLAPLVMVNAADKGTWELTTNDITSVYVASLGANKTLTQLDPVTTADTGYNPFLATVKVTAASSTVNMNASQLRRTATDNLTLGEGVIFGTWRPTVPRDYLDMGKVSAGGVGVMIADASNNYRMWCVGAQLSRTTKPSDRQNYIIDVSSVNTTWAKSTTVPSLNAIQDWYFAGSGYFGACAVEWSGLYLLNKFVVAGGSSSVPVDFDAIVDVVNAGGGYMPFVEKAGSAGTFWVPVQIGGGEACHVGVDLAVVQFPRRADGKKYLDANIWDNKHGIEFYGKDRGSGDVDTIRFRNTVFTAPTSYYWRFNASHAAGATVDFSGSTVVGAAVTLVPSATLSNMAFIGCSSFTHGGATLDSVEFDSTTVLTTVSDLDSLTNSSFLSSGSGHAIEITGAGGSATLSGTTFTGYQPSGDPSGDPYWGNTVLLMHMDGEINSTTYVDVKGKTVTSAGAFMSTSQQVFGAASSYTDGTNDYVQVAASSDFLFELGVDFTIEFWVRFVTVSGFYKAIFGIKNSTVDFFQLSWSPLGYLNDWAVTQNDQLNVAFSHPTKPVVNTWYHVALVRKGVGTGNLTLYIDGVGASITNTVTLGSASSPLTLGAASASMESPFYGYLDELRVTKGVARYTADFTPPTAAFPDVGGVGSEAIYVNIADRVQLSPILTASPVTTDDQFGYRVAISGDASVLVVTASIFSAYGALYTYDWSGTAWVQRGSRVDGVAGVELISGLALNHDGTILMVQKTTTSIRTYDWSGSAWTARSGGDVSGGVSHFGDSMSLNGAGDVLVVGSPSHDGNGYGAVLTYDWSGSAWVQRGSSLLADDAYLLDNFGTSVSINADATVLIASAPNWETTGGSNRGRVYTFDWSGSAWVQRGYTLAGAADNNLFGYECKLDGSGDRLVALVTANTVSLGIEVYDWSGSAWVLHGSRFNGSETASADGFGYGLSFSADGKTLVAGAPLWEGGTGTNVGAVYTFNYNEVVLNISGGDTPGIRSAGAPVTVVSTAPVTVTVKDALTLSPLENARVRVVTSSGGNVVLEGMTNASGVLTGYTTYIGSEVSGTVRRATAAYGALYKPSTMSATVGTDGFTVTVLMASDE